MNRMTTTNIAGWLMGRIIAENYWLMTSQINVPEDKRPIINMKNEFYYGRIMLTKNKKNYAGIVNMQEGVILEKPDIDIKGLAIKKVSVTSTVRTYFTKMLVEDMLSPKTISLSKVISKYQALDNQIRMSLTNGEIDFLKPDKVNMIDSYKTPYQIQSVRGTLLWNQIFPENEISIPNKINIVKTTLNTIEDVENSNIPDIYKERIKNLFSEIHELEKYGATVIAIPKTVDKIPEWMLPYIDIFTMVNDNMKPGKILLETLGFKEMNVMKQQIATNIIDI